MQADILHAGDLFYFRRDLYRAYLDNHLIEDIQTPYRITCEQDLVDYLAGFISEQDSMVVGIFDNNKRYCYGYIIYDNIRCADKMVAKLGFKKTGYIPCALPYKNSKGETKLYDINIFVYEKKGKGQDD